MTILKMQLILFLLVSLFWADQAPFQNIMHRFDCEAGIYRVIESHWTNNKENVVNNNKSGHLHKKSIFFLPQQEF